MNEDEPIAPLPTKGVTFKDFNDHLPDIKEATLEGSQFEAPAYTGALVPQYPANTAQPGTNSEKPFDSGNGDTAASRPKTSMPRRTNSEKSLKDEDIPKSSNISRKPTQESLRPDTITPSIRAPDMTVVNGHGNLSDRRGANSQSTRKTPTCETPDIRSTSRISRKGTNGDIHSHGHLSRKGTNSEIQQSRKGLSREPTIKSSLKHHVDGGSLTPESREVVQRKGKVVTDAWSSTTLSSQAPTEASDDALEDHINVVLRVRPLNTGEITRKDQFTCSFPGAGKIECDNNGSTRQFGYNVVFEPEASQEDLFEHSGVKKLIDMALNGYACTALAFGQTGSGKTHTMTGPPQQFQEGKQVDPQMYGIIQRSLKHLFAELNQQQGTKIIRASYLEIYNEQVIDLLNPNMRRYLQVRWSKNKGFYVENLFVVECESVDDLMAVLEEGMRNRQTGSHGLNEFSSRSHSMLMLTIDSEQQDPEDENLYITKRGKLTFVDLAGSEKVKDSNSTAETLVESNNINRSLLILGNCISSLGDPKRRQGHIPYRDSKLTKLLADSLGGNGVTLMICCITPSSHHASETMNTLRYASRAKKIRTKPVIKMDPREKLILSLKKEIKVLRNENHYLRQQLEFPAKPKGQLQKENDQNFVKIMKETNGKPNPPNNTLPPQEKLMQNGAKDESGLYEMLQEYMVENESLRTENSEMQVARDKQRQEQQLLYRDNEKLMKRVDELERKVSQVQNSWQAMPRQGSDPVRSRDHSPTRGSPQYAMPGSGGRQPPNRLPPPHDLPLRDPVYTGSPSQGYNSPTGSGKGKQPSRGQPLKPPHRLNEPLPQQRPVQEQNGPYMNGHPHPAQYRQNPGSPNRSNEMRMDSRRSSQSTSSDAIRDMNEKLKQELAQLEGQIHQHTAVNSRNRNIYGSQGSIR